MNQMNNQFNLKELEYSIEIIDDKYNTISHNYSSHLQINQTQLYKPLKITKDFVSIFDNVLDDDWCEYIYSYILSRDCTPWGIYITMKDALDSNLNSFKFRETDEMKAIGFEVIRSFLLTKCKNIIENDLSYIHGIAIWCLASDELDSVEYHIDYAELYRYENNIIVPPLFAGTIQVTSFNSNEMEGGDFLVNIDGLNHYKRFGYKGRNVNNNELVDDMNSSTSWNHIQYTYNRGIIHDGDFPHLSSKINKISSTCNDVSHKKKRVIIGINCFSNIVSECCIRAPEHSNTFNRTIKLYQSLQKTKPCKSSFSIQDVLKNPQLAKLIVSIAKKVRKKNEE